MFVRLADLTQEVDVWGRSRQLSRSEAIRPQNRAWVKVEEMKRSRSEIYAMVVTSAGLLAVWGGLAVLAVVIF